jgi:hypothetical protein
MAINENCRSTLNRFSDSRKRGANNDKHPTSTSRASRMPNSRKAVPLLRHALSSRVSEFAILQASLLRVRALPDRFPHQVLGGHHLFNGAPNFFCGLSRNDNHTVAIRNHIITGADIYIANLDRSPELSVIQLPAMSRGVKIRALGLASDRFCGEVRGKRSEPHSGYPRVLGRLLASDALPETAMPKRTTIVAIFTSEDHLLLPALRLKDNSVR